jgi:hypothetical protein
MNMEKNPENISVFNPQSLAQMELIVSRELKNQNLAQMESTLIVL